MRTVVGVLTGVLLGLVVGCAAVESVDRSRLSHPAMDLTKDNTPAQSFYLTNLNGIQSTSSGGSCTACAH